MDDLSYLTRARARRVIGGGGSGEAVLINKSISANGTYNASADEADGYRKVTVNVPAPTLVSKTITANGVYDPAADSADGYSAVTVDVAGYTVDQWLDRNVVTSVTSDRTTLRKYALYSQTAVTSLWLPNVTDIGDYALAGLTGLTEIVLPAATVFGTGALYSCSNLNALDTKGTRLSSVAFSYCSRLSTLVLRSATLVTLDSTNTFTGTPWAWDNVDNSTALYVPQALISAYQAATNWSTVLARAGKQILPIEGSVYETQYADGTPIPTT